MPFGDWLELGVVGMLAAGLLWLVYQLIKRTDCQAEQHRVERKEWQKESSDNANKIERALDSLADAIRNRHL